MQLAMIPDSCKVDLVWTRFGLFLQSRSV